MKYMIYTDIRAAMALSWETIEKNERMELK